MEFQYSFERDSFMGSYKFFTYFDKGMPAQLLNTICTNKQHTVVSISLMEQTIYSEITFAHLFLSMYLIELIIMSMVKSQI